MIPLFCRFSVVFAAQADVCIRCTGVVVVVVVVDDDDDDDDDVVVVVVVMIMLPLPSPSPLLLLLLLLMFLFWFVVCCVYSTFPITLMHSLVSLQPKRTDCNHVFLHFVPCIIIEPHRVSD